MKDQEENKLSLKELLMKLIGEIRPAGESHKDTERLKNLKTLCALVDDLVGDIDAVQYDNRNAYEASIKEAAKYAGDFLTHTLGIPDEPAPKLPIRELATDTQMLNKIAEMVRGVVGTIIAHQYATEICMTSGYSLFIYDCGDVSLGHPQNGFLPIPNCLQISSLILSKYTVEV